MPGSISSLYPEWFHYTNIDGLRGILTSQTLRATHFEYLNDELEIRAFKAKLPDLLIPRISRLPPKTLNRIHSSLLDSYKRDKSKTKNFANFIASTAYSAWLGEIGAKHFSQNFITSFSFSNAQSEAQQGIPSQWHKYCANSGFSIVFDSGRLELLFSQEGARWGYDLFGGDLVYSDEDEKLEMEFGTNIDVILEAYCHWFDNVLHAEPLEKTWHPLIYCACRYKRAKYRDENEVRIVAVLLDKSKTSIKVDSENHTQKSTDTFLRDSKNIPCIYLLDKITDIKNNQLPINRILVSPGSGTSERRRAVETLLNECGLNIGISVSNL